MISTSPLRFTAPGPHDDFLEILPIVENAARFYFRGWPAAHRDEALAEAVAAALVGFIGLKRRGKDPFAFPSVIAFRAVQHVRSDRHVGSRFNRHEILSAAARRQYEFYVTRIGTRGWGTALADNSQTPVPDQVWFRLDVPVWLNTLKPRDRQIALRLAQGDTVTDVAADFDLTPGRISQLRRELYQSWQDFQGELDASKD